MNDLADLMAEAMKSPYDAVAYRPTVFRLRNKPEWIELLPHLGQFGIEVHLKTDLPAIAEAWPEFADRPHLSVSNRTMYLNPDDIKQVPDKALLGELHGKVGMMRNSFRHVIETTRMALSRAETFGTVPESDAVYQFKITLRDSQPMIRRRMR